MKLSAKTVGATNVKYTIQASEAELTKFRDLTAEQFTNKVKVPGFRPGKAPVAMIIKYADPNDFQNQFLNLAVSELFVSSQQEISLRFVGEPKITIAKFVPYSTLEVAIETPIIKDVKLPPYSQLKVSKTDNKVTAKQLDLALSELQKRIAKLQPSDTVAKNGDLLVLDFEASDPKTKEPLAQASAKGYRVILGDNTLIPGFEEELVGLKKEQTKNFDLTFPKDYFDKTYAGRQVSFKATVNEVNKVELAKLDDDFAKQVSPFDTLDKLKEEVKKQLQAENDNQATIELENRLLDTLAEKTTVNLDQELVNQELTHLVADAKKAALNRGQTWMEFLASLGKTEEAYQDELKVAAKRRLKAGLAISEIAEKEGLEVNDQELRQKIEILKNRYQDEQMRAELDNPANQRDIKMRMLTEKVLDFIQQKTVKSPKPTTS